MSTLWHWLLAILSSVVAIFPQGNAATIPSDTVLPHVEQQYGDTPEVQGITTSLLPPAQYKREVARKDDWTPPVTDDLTAASIMIMDKSSGRILWSRNPEKVWPTASITKLMSAIIFMEQSGDTDEFWQTTYTMKEDDEADGTVYIYRNEDATVEELFHLSLIGSINSTTRAMLHAIGLSTEDAVHMMNKKARSFGLWNTSFSDVTGLSSENVTTAKEAAWLLKEALAYDKIRDALLMPSYDVILPNGRGVRVQNTNKLLGTDLVIEGGKTGFITESGYNFTVSVENEAGDAVIIVVMGTAAPELRFTEAASLAEWTFDNYIWQ